MITLILKDIPGPENWKKEFTDFQRPSRNSGRLVSASFHSMSQRKPDHCDIAEHRHLSRLVVNNYWQTGSFFVIHLLTDSG